MHHTITKLTVMCCTSLPRNILFPARMSANTGIFVPVPEECIGLVIGRGGSNINRIKQETQTRIEKSPKRGELGRESGFYVTGGSEADRKRAEQAIKRYVVSTILFCLYGYDRSKIHPDRSKTTQGTTEKV